MRDFQIVKCKIDCLLSGFLNMNLEWFIRTVRQQAFVLYDFLLEAAGKYLFHALISNMFNRYCYYAFQTSRAIIINFLYQHSIKNNKGLGPTVCASAAWPDFFLSAFYRKQRNAVLTIFRGALPRRLLARVGRTFFLSPTRLSLPIPGGQEYDPLPFLGN